MQVADWKSNKKLFLGGVQYFFVKNFKKKVLRKKIGFSRICKKKIGDILK